MLFITRVSKLLLSSLQFPILCGSSEPFIPSQGSDTTCTESFPAGTQQGVLAASPPPHPAAWAHYQKRPSQLPPRIQRGEALGSTGTDSHLPQPLLKRKKGLEMLKPVEMLLALMLQLF